MSQHILSNRHVISQILLLAKDLAVGHVLYILKNGKAIPLQAWAGPKCSRRFRLPDFKTIGT